MLPIKLFRLVFCSFRFNRNIENLCFGIEAKQPKQTFCFGQCRNQFRFQFRLFRIETSFEGHPNPNPTYPNIMSATYIMIPYVKKESLRYKRPPPLTLQKTPYIMKYCTFRSDSRFVMMYVAKQKTFQNDFPKQWRYNDVGCIGRGKYCSETFFM